MKTKPALIVALDNLNVTDIQTILTDMRSAKVEWLKVGLELYIKLGSAFIKELKKLGFKVFLDLKLHDIPNTVCKAIEATLETGADLLTIHALGGKKMLTEAQLVTEKSNLKLLAVTILTSHDSKDIEMLSKHFLGSEKERIKIVESLIQTAFSSNIPGVVCSAPDLMHSSLIQNNQGKYFVTPGIRNQNDLSNDQKSIATVSEAIRAGATHLVMGRPILQPVKGDRVSAAKIILNEIEIACAI